MNYHKHKPRRRRYTTTNIYTKDILKYSNNTFTKGNTSINPVKLKNLDIYNSVFIEKYF